MNLYLLSLPLYHYVYHFSIAGLEGKMKWSEINLEELNYICKVCLILYDSAHRTTSNWGCQWRYGMNRYDYSLRCNVKISKQETTSLQLYWRQTLPVRYLIYHREVYLNIDRKQSFKITETLIPLQYINIKAAKYWH